MCEGCSEISISVIVKHVQKYCNYQAFLSAWLDLLSFSVPGGIEKNAGF